MKTSPYRNKVGYVYLLQILNRYKIGSTQNIENRLQSHLSHYQKIRIVAYAKVVDCFELERKIQKVFQWKREGKSELFRLTDFEVQIVEYILNVESKPLQTENNVSHYFSSSFK